MASLIRASTEAGRIASKILSDGFSTDFTTRSKSERNDLVTDFDIASENAIIEFLSSEFPDHDFLAEESGLNSQSRSIQWIVDPLDGTVNFAHGVPIYSVSIAAVEVHEESKELLVGVVNGPALNEEFTGAFGRGAELNGKTIHVSSLNDLSIALLVTGFPYTFGDHFDANVTQLRNVLKRGIPLRRLGSAALDLSYVASGRFDGFWEFGLKQWDVAAGVLLVREAGGTVTTISGSEYALGDETIVASNGLIHNHLLELLNEC